MKSKAYIQRQITELLEKNRGMCEVEIQDWFKENQDKTVYELLTIKKQLTETQEYKDVSCMRWFREED